MSYENNNINTGNQGVGHTGQDKVFDPKDAFSSGGMNG